MIRKRQRKSQAQRKRAWILKWKKLKYIYGGYQFIPDFPTKKYNDRIMAKKRTKYRITWYPRDKHGVRHGMLKMNLKINLDNI